MDIIEQKILELEHFTKKKFDELVSEIKNFIPNDLDKNLIELYRTAIIRNTIQPLFFTFTLS